VFGEDALLNISVEREASGALCGYNGGAACNWVAYMLSHSIEGDTCTTGSLAGAIRIRAKTQGIALSLGDRVTAKQKAK